MNGQQTFRARLRVRLGKALSSDDFVLVAKIGGREVEIKSERKDETLRNAKWVEFTTGGFPSKEEAQAFGEQLRTIAGIVGVCTRVGIDVGDDKSTTSITEEWARSLGIMKSEKRIHPNIHGLMIHPDDGLSRFPKGGFQGYVTHDPTQIVKAVEGFGLALPQALSTAEIGVRLLNRALMSVEPLTQIVLALSVVEALGQDEKWTENQASILQRLADNLEAGDDGDEEIKEVAHALRRNVHRISLRQGVLRVLQRLHFGHLKKEWDRLYEMRSGVFHGTQHLDEKETLQLAADCVTLCGKIVIALLKQEGIQVPSVADAHYPTETPEQ